MGAVDLIWNNAQAGMPCPLAGADLKSRSSQWNQKSCMYS